MPFPPAPGPTSQMSLFNTFQSDYSDPSIKDRLMREAWDFFRGRTPKSIAIGENGEDDNATVPFAHQIVTAYDGYAIPQVLRINVKKADRPAPLGPDASPEDEAAHTALLARITAAQDAEDTINRVWSPKPRTLMVKKGRRQAGVTGQGFLSVSRRPGGRTRLTLLPSANWRSTPSAHDASIFVRHEGTWVAPNEEGKDTDFQKVIVATTLDVDGVPAAWRITDYFRPAGTGLLGRAHGWKEVASYPWPHAQAPIVTWQNLTSTDTWGEPDITEADRDRVVEIESVLSQLVKGNRLRNDPLLKFGGVTEKQWIAMRKGSAGSDAVMGFPTPDAAESAKYLEPTGAGMEASLALLDKLCARFFDGVAMADPEVADNKVGDTAVGVSQLRLTPMVKRVEDIRLNLEVALEETCRLILLCEGKDTDFEFEFPWGPILPVSMLTLINEAKGLNDLGASAETVLEHVGLDPVAERANHEAAQAAAAGRVDPIAARLDALLGNAANPATLPEAPGPVVAEVPAGQATTQGQPAQAA